MPAEAARRLRRNMTEAEKVVWRLVRARQLVGFKFRRQEPIGRYIVDFVCFSPQLVIEIDGGQHASATEYDNARSAFLAGEGFRILRFWNHDVLGNREGVCAQILQILEFLGGCTPHLPGASRRAPPSPTRGERM